MTTKKAIDKFEWLTERFIELVEAGTNPWRKEWRTNGTGVIQNFVTGQAYKGANPLILQIDTLCRGEDLPYYCGFSHGQEKRWKLAKGSKAAWVIYANVQVREDNEGNQNKIPFVKWYPVYHLSCWDDSESNHKISEFLPEKQEPLNLDERIEAIDRFVTRTKANIKTQGSQPCYSSSQDTIMMPKWEDFTGAEAYYGTLLHELTHWTGHSDRCNRKLGNKFGSTAYAREELIAEMGAAMLCQNFSIGSNLENHASYLSGWLEGAKEDSKFLYKSMTEARKAFEYVTNL